MHCISDGSDSVTVHISFYCASDPFHTLTLLRSSVFFYSARRSSRRPSNTFSGLLLTFHMRCQRRILNINWTEFISNDEVSDPNFFQLPYSVDIGLATKKNGSRSISEVDLTFSGWCSCRSHGGPTGCTNSPQPVSIYGPLVLGPWSI